MVDDLLDVMRISRGTVQLKRQRIDLADAVRKTADDMRRLFEQSGIELRLGHSAGAAWVDADPTRIAQVLANLLQNSLKFVPRGGAVEVSLAVADGCARLGIKDTGIGIEPRLLERMFQPFAQADQGLARTTGGLGLGLHLVKSFVELHGGSVEAKSDGVGRGAEFVVSLPLAETEMRPEPASSLSRTAALRDVLVIEDNADAAQALSDVLTLLGHAVRVAMDSRSGLALARERKPDVIVCDIGLPDLDGYEVARAVRGDDSLRGTRLVALTGYAQPEDRERAIEAGFDVHLPKPPTPEMLARVLAE
jgi:CheY-like chemotaxis protein